MLPIPHLYIHGIHEYTASIGNRALELNELIIEVQSFDSIDALMGFFNSCRNIKKFALYSECTVPAGLHNSLRNILSLFTQLEELTISVLGPIEQDELFNMITDTCMDLRKLTLPRIFASNAQILLHDSDLIIVYQDQTEDSALNLRVRNREHQNVNERPHFFV
jgi:hypothetical protein